MPAQSHASSTRVDEIIDGIFRISTSVPATVVPGGFTFNQYLIRDADPLLFHTGPRMLFDAVREAIERVLPVATLGYISFSHVEADEYGSLKQFLAAAPQTVPLCCDALPRVLFKPTPRRHEWAKGRRPARQFW